MDIEGGVIFGVGGRPVNPIVWLLDEEDELVIGWRNRGVEAVKESDGFFSCNVVVVLVYLEDVDRGGGGWLGGSYLWIRGLVGIGAFRWLFKALFVFSDAPR